MISGRYQLRDKLGSGSMGGVYRAWDRLTQRTIALKKVEMPATALEFGTRGIYLNERRALTHEFRILAGLRHPNIVSVLDYGFDDTTPFFTMELIEYAQNLTAYGKECNEREKIDLLIDVLQALSFLHRRNIKHRDIKPDNIMVTAEGQVKVMDFGLALDRSLTSEKNLVGTLTYMAPECFGRQPATVESDLYSLGIITYELFVADYPFTKETFSLFIADILSKKPDTSMLDDSLGAVLDRLLMKQPEDRYHSAQAVIKALCNATNRPLPEESQSIRESLLQAAPFIGRETEIQALETALQNSFAGEGSAYLIGGESGVGKSRLIDELAIQAMVERALVVRGQAVESGGLPYQLWRDVLPRLILNIELNELEASVLKDLVPNISQLLDYEVATVPELTGEAYQQRLMFTITDVLRRQEQSVVLLLEDLQWAIESLSVFKHLLNFVQDYSWLIVGTYRNDEAPDLPEQFQKAEPINLKRLNETEIASMSQAILGEVGKQTQILALLQKETEGNAFFMVEVVRALAEEAGRLDNIAKMTLPDHVFAGGIQKIVQRRLGHVPQWGQDMLKYAAITGRQLDLKVLENIAHHALVEQSLNEWLRTCYDANVLEFQHEAWRFNHDKLREQVLRDLPDENRPELHRRVAEAIEQTYPDDEMLAETLADHWHLAQDNEKEVMYTLQAIEQLDIISKYERMIQLAERGLKAVPDQTARAQLLLWSGRAYGAADIRQSVKFYEEALDLSQEIGEQGTFASAMIGIAGIRWEHYEFDQAEELLSEALTIMREINDPYGIVNAQMNLGIIAGLQDEYKRSEILLQDCLAIAKIHNLPRVVGTCMINLGELARRKGKWDLAIQYNSDALELTEKGGYRGQKAFILRNLGQIEIENENFAQAEKYLQSALRIAKEIHAVELMTIIFRFLKRIAQSHNNFSLARAYYYMAISVDSYQLQQGSPSDILDFIVRSAELVIERGNNQQAGTWLGVVVNHADYNQNIKLWSGLTLKQITNPILSELGNILSTDTLDTALERGKSLDLDTVVQEISDEFREDAANHDMLSNTNFTSRYDTSAKK